MTDEGINILGKEGETTLTATYNGIKVEKAINVISAEVGARVPQLLNDGREYPIEVVSKVGFDSFVTDPSRLDWTVADPEIVKAEKRSAQRSQERHNNRYRPSADR